MDIKLNSSSPVFHRPYNLSVDEKNRVLPYVLANAPIVYQRIISKTLKPLIDTGRVLTYIDDVLILSHTVEEGLDTLCQVLKVLIDSGFSVSLKKKCTFLHTEIEYLGRRVGHGQVRPNPGKIAA